MNKILAIAATILLIGFALCFANNKDQSRSQLKLSPSFKGYELYSWQVDNEWYFTLTSGTNRAKTYDEIVSSENYISDKTGTKITVKDLDSIKTVLTLLPANEQVLWSANISPNKLSLPSEEIVNDLDNYCKQLGIKLVTP